MSCSAVELVLTARCRAVSTPSPSADLDSDDVLPPTQPELLRQLPDVPRAHLPAIPGPDDLSHLAGRALDAVRHDHMQREEHGRNVASVERAGGERLLIGWGSRNRLPCRPSVGLGGTGLGRCHGWENLLEFGLQSRYCLMGSLFFGRR